MDKKIKNISTKECPKDFIEIPKELYEQEGIKRDSFIKKIKNLKYQISPTDFDFININQLKTKIKNPKKYKLLTLNAENKIVLNPTTCLIRVGKRHRIKIHKSATYLIDSTQLEEYELKNEDPKITTKILLEKINKIKFHDEDNSIGIQWNLMNEIPISLKLEKKEYKKIQKEIQDIKTLINIATKTIEGLYLDNIKLQDQLFTNSSKNQSEDLKKLIKKDSK